jgi:hypothetical protein
VEVKAPPARAETPEGPRLRSGAAASPQSTHSRLKSTPSSISLSQLSLSGSQLFEIFNSKTDTAVVAPSASAPTQNDMYTYVFYPLVEAEVK